MAKGIEQHVIEEGHVKAVKDIGDFGGCNMWRLHVKDADGRFREIQWMDVYNIQKFFKTKLPQYRETETNKYEKI